MGGHRPQRKRPIQTLHGLPGSIANWQSLNDESAEKHPGSIQFPIVPPCFLPRKSLDLNLQAKISGLLAQIAKLAGEGELPLALSKNPWLKSWWNPIISELWLVYPNMKTPSSSFMALYRKKCCLTIQVNTPNDSIPLVCRSITPILSPYYHPVGKDISKSPCFHHFSHHHYICIISRFSPHIIPIILSKKMLYSNTVQFVMKSDCIQKILGISPYHSHIAGSSQSIHISSPCSYPTYGWYTADIVTCSRVKKSFVFDGSILYIYIYMHTISI